MQDREMQNHLIDSVQSGLALGQYFNSKISKLYRPYHCCKMN